MFLPIPISELITAIESGIRSWFGIRRDHRETEKADHELRLQRSGLIASVSNDVIVSIDCTLAKLIDAGKKAQHRKRRQVIRSPLAYGFKFGLS